MIRSMLCILAVTVFSAIALSAPYSIVEARVDIDVPQVEGSTDFILNVELPPDVPVFGPYDCVASICAPRVFGCDVYRPPHGRSACCT